MPICSFGDSSELLPPNLNPVEAGVVSATNFEMIELFKIFDANDGSMRHYDYTSYLDGATFGMGHWHQGGAYRFFNDLNRDYFLRQIFIDRTFEYFLRNDLCFKLIGINCSSENVSAFLDKSVFSEEFFRPYSRPRINSLFRDYLWLKDLFSYAFRDKELVRWQLNYYDRFLLEKVRQNDLPLLGMSGIPAFLVLASLRSSGSSYPMKMHRHIQNKTGIFKKNNFYEKPSGVSNLKIWKVYLSWKWYNLQKGKLRSRMKKIYCLYLESEFSSEKIDC